MFHLYFVFILVFILVSFFVFAFIQKIYRLWVTGHGLGGGYATLFFSGIRGTRALPDYIEICDAYTFGSPRVGDLEFYNARICSSKRWKERERGEKQDGVEIRRKI
jgi:Lipase (class 3)